MKLRILLSLALIAGLMQWAFSGSKSGHAPDPAGAAALKAWYGAQTDSLIVRLDALSRHAAAGAPAAALRGELAACRILYKKVEAIAEFYFQGMTKRINGPALPDVRIADGMVWPPHGFQVLEELLYKEYTDTKLFAEIRLLQADLRFMRDNLAVHTVRQEHLGVIVQHQLIRIAALGITGSDAPLSKNGIAEALHCLYGLKDMYEAYTGRICTEPEIVRLFSRCTLYLASHPDFDAFDRLGFLTDYLMPLSEALVRLPGLNSHSGGTGPRPFTGTLSALMKGSGFNADYYSGYAAGASNNAKTALGKRLFGDRQLSGSRRISCADCHQPALYFTDGLPRARNPVQGGSLSRNTPTLYYAGLQSHQFYDMRSVTLEDQADAVMNNPHELACSPSVIARRLMRDSAYVRMFRQAFPGMGDSLSGYQVRNALAAFVRSLSPFSSPFDAYMRGRREGLDREERAGFNLFAGKAKCGSCHFMPLFSGNLPPWYTRSESEIIGVPGQPVWTNARIDPDPGLHAVWRLPALRFAFKTPTVRNSGQTPPYMHNGIYKTLEEVVRFYHKGGGAGLGMTLPGQSLPFDSLSLNEGEQRAIVRFLHALTDQQAGRDYSE